MLVWIVIFAVHFIFCCCRTDFFFLITEWNLPGCTFLVHIQFILCIALGFTYSPIGLLYLMLGSFFFVHFFYSHFTCAQTFYQVLFIDRCLSDVLFNTGFFSICEVVACYLTMQDNIFTFHTWCRERHHYQLHCYKTSTHTHAVSTTWLGHDTWQHCQLLMSHVIYLLCLALEVLDAFNTRCLFVCTELCTTLVLLSYSLPSK
jgi:hypothetical protein